MAAAAKTLQASITQDPPPPSPPSKSLVNESTGKCVVHWFRKGLRLHDNPSLREGLVDATTFRCVFIIDPWFASSSNVGINKWRFLLQCLEDLDQSLRKLNSRLFVVRGQPTDALPKLFREWGITTLTFEEDPEPYGKIRDQNITRKCQESGISVISRASHTLYQLDNIIERNGGKAPLTYHQFQVLLAKMPPPPAAESSITLQTLNGATTPISRDHDVRFGVPTLEELGFDTEGIKPPVWIGGEQEALARLERHMERKTWVATFGRPKLTSQSLLANQTCLSPYLRFGCLSTRRFYFELLELYKKVKRGRPPLSLHGQILWREFFYCAATKNPNFDRMVSNPICVQIPWETNREALMKWANGQTGYPWIDAIMIQLREEGWIHQLARHAVACFLTRGDLWISWEEGMKVFDELLLDADWSVNAGMWMWLSCSSFFQQFFHCYCPVGFGRKTDPNGDFIRKYIPILKNMPSQYIHEPWMAPRLVQQAANCVIGQDYPLPMVDHERASQINIERIKQVYTQLTKYKPQVTNPQVQRPNMRQSSPSPTSIVKDTNQSSYLCSQAPESQSSNNPMSRNNKQEDVFIRPTQNIIKFNVDSKKTQFKRVLIVQEDQNAKKNQQNTTSTDSNYIVNSLNVKDIEIQHMPKPNNYDLNKLNVKKPLQTMSDSEEGCHSPQQRNECYQQNIIASDYINRPKNFYKETETEKEDNTPDEVNDSSDCHTGAIDNKHEYTNKRNIEHSSDN